VLEGCLEYNFQASDLKQRFEEKLMHSNERSFKIDLCNNLNFSREFGLDVVLDQSTKKGGDIFDVKITNIYTLFFIPP